MTITILEDENLIKEGSHVIVYSVSNFKKNNEIYCLFLLIFNF